MEKQDTTLLSLAVCDTKAQFEWKAKSALAPSFQFMKWFRRNREQISPNLLYLCIPNLLIIIIVEAIFPLATVITIQSTRKSQSGFKWFCFQSVGLMQPCTFARHRKKKETFHAIKFKQIFLIIAEFKLSNQTCPRWWYLGLNPGEAFQKLSRLSPDHCPSFEKASKIMENFLKVIVLYQTQCSTVWMWGEKSKILCSFCCSSTELMSNLSKDIQE